ncbi:hypothetical protein BDN71DRAFT_1395141, partial [Pleurotus eryngii]
RSSATVQIPSTLPERLPPTPPHIHHHISEERWAWKNIYQFLSTHEGDPVLQNFIPQLKSHLLARLLGQTYNGDEHEYSSDQLDTVLIVNDRLYFHKVLRVNYTTYDGRCSQDSLNPRTHTDFISLSLAPSDDPDHDPFWYGHIMYIFHVEV